MYMPTMSVLSSAPPLRQNFPALVHLLADENFWSSLILAIVSGLLGSLVTGAINRVTRKAQAHESESEAWQRHMDAVEADLVKPMEDRLTDLRATVRDQQAQIDELRARQDTYAAAVQYIRRQGHWLDELCGAALVPRSWMRSHPKPRLPDELRDELGQTPVGTRQRDPPPGRDDTKKMNKEDK